MNYTTTLFYKGRKISENEFDAKSHLQAAKYARMTFYDTIDHIRVVGKTVKRYTWGLKLIKGEPRLFKANVTSRPSILLMVDNAVEFTRYPSTEARDKAFEEASCIPSLSAASVAASPEPTDTTASSEETNWQS
jgi:hypothetical protein